MSMEMELEPVPFQRTNSMSKIVPKPSMDANKRRAVKSLVLALLFTTIFMVGEIVGGYFANSLAILTDAAHLLTDIGAMLLSLFAMWLASRPPTSKLTFGYHRAEILGALASVLLIWALTAVLVYEAIMRIIHPPDLVEGRLMFFIALGGLFINILDAIILNIGAGGHGHSHGLGHGHSHNHHHSDKGKKKNENKDKVKEKEKELDQDEKCENIENLENGNTKHIQTESSDKHQHEHNDHDHEHHDDHKKKDKTKKKEVRNINVHSAFIHVIGDCVQSVGVMIASGLIWYNPQWKVADPIVTLVFAVIVLFTTIRLLKQSLSVLMESVPQGFSRDEISNDLYSIEGVEEIHDLHIWSLTINSPSLSVHLSIAPNFDSHTILIQANNILKLNHEITHTTIQIERIQMGEGIETEEIQDICETVTFHNGKHGKLKMSHILPPSERIYP